jgi:S1-C subfamily serine protease
VSRGCGASDAASGFWLGWLELSEGFSPGWLPGMQPPPAHVDRMLLHLATPSNTFAPWARRGAMSRWFAAFFLAALTLEPAFVSAISATDELARCVVFFRQEVPPGSPANVGSGFLVARAQDVYLVTAAHVARNVGSDWTLFVQGSDGRPVKTRMQQPPWEFAAQHDVAVLLLAPKEDQKAFLLSRSLPMKTLSARPLPPSRDITLTVMGYPLGMGVQGFISPLSRETKAASGFITLPRADTQQPATFIVLQDPSIGGLSGGPVFDTGLPHFTTGRRMIVREGLSLVGLMHGEWLDKGGGKMAAVVPASEIVSLLDIAAGMKQ